MEYNEITLCTSVCKTVPARKVTAAGPFNPRAYIYRNYKNTKLRYSTTLLPKSYGDYTYMGHFSELPADYTPISGGYFQNSTSRVCTYGRNPEELILSGSKYSIQWAVKTSDLCDVNISQARHKDTKDMFEIRLVNLHNIKNYPRLGALLLLDKGNYVLTAERAVYLKSDYASDAQLQHELDYMCFADNGEDGMIIPVNRFASNQSVSLSEPLRALYFKNKSELYTTLKGLGLLIPMHGGTLHRGTNIKVYQASNGYVISGLTTEHIIKLKGGDKLIDYLCPKLTFREPTLIFSAVAEDIELENVQSLKDTYIHLDFNGRTSKDTVNTLWKTWSRNNEIFLTSDDEKLWVGATPARIKNYNIPKNMVYRALNGRYQDREIIRKDLLTKDNKIKRDPYAQIKHKPHNPKSWDLAEVQAYSDAVENVHNGKYVLINGSIKGIEPVKKDSGAYGFDKLGILPANYANTRSLGFYRHCNCIFADAELLKSGELFQRLVEAAKRGELYASFTKGIEEILKLVAALDAGKAKADLLLLSFRGKA